MNIPIVVAFFQTTLAGKIDTSSATCVLESVTDSAGNAVSGLVGAVINEGLANEEAALGTLSGTTLTFTLRGVDPQNPGTEVTALKEEHDRGSSVKITNYPVLGILRDIANGDEGSPNVLKYDGSKAFTTARHIPDKGYVDAATASAGGITAFMVTDDDTGLDISVGAGRWMKEGSMQTFAGASAQAVTDDDVTYVQIKRSDGSLVLSIVGFLDGHIPLAEVTAVSGDITALDDHRTWLSIADPNVSTTFTYGATLAALDPVYVDASASNKLKKALATGASTADVVGICLDAGVDTDTDKRVALPGAIITGLSGLTASAAVYLTDAGGFVDSAGTFKKVVGWALTTTTMLFLPQLGPEDLAGGNSSATLANFNEMMTLINATDVTGAELETLTDGSNADDLHTHVPRNLDKGSTHIELRLNEDTAFAEDLAGGGHGRSSATSFLNQISSNGTGGATVAIEDTSLFSWAKDHVIDVWVKLGSAAAQDAFIGLGAQTEAEDVSDDATEVKRHIAFYIQDGTVFASAADGTTQEKSADLGVTVTDLNRYRIEFTSGTDAKFYVNGVLVATLSTNLPTTGTTDYNNLKFGIEGDSVAKTLFWATGALLSIET